MALDNGFALAYKRLARALGWLRGRTHPLTNVSAMRAGALNHGLAPRDSLLVFIDSATGALGASQPPSPPLAARLFAAVQEAVQRYPEDPEAWHELGEARAHFDWLVELVSMRAKLEPFERSIALDSFFGPAYMHAVELSYALGDTARAHRLAAALVRLNPDLEGRSARGLEALDRLLALRDSAAQDRILDTLPGEVLSALDGWGLAHWPDSLEIGVRIVRHQLRAAQDSNAAKQARVDLAHTLAVRGHLREALAVSDTLSQFVFAETALLGYMPAERAAARFSAWLRARSPFPSVLALPWWGAQRDTVALSSFMRLADSTARNGAPDWSPGDFRLIQMVTAARAHLALHGATRPLPCASTTRCWGAHTPCTGWCQLDKLLAARLLIGRGRLTEAARILNAPPTLEGVYVLRPSDVLWYLERGRVAERLGDRARASEAYRYVAAAWQHPDPELEPYVAEAHEGLQRLTAEPGR